MAGFEQVPDGPGVGPVVAAVEHVGEWAQQQHRAGERAKYEQDRAERAKALARCPPPPARRSRRTTRRTAARRRPRPPPVRSRASRAPCRCRRRCSATSASIIGAGTRFALRPASDSMLATKSASRIGFAATEVDDFEAGPAIGRGDDAVHDIGDEGPVAVHLAAVVERDWLAEADALSRTR